MSQRPKLCIVVPCYNEQHSIGYFFKEMDAIEPSLPVELTYVLVNDGSRDETLDVMRNANADRPEKVHYLSFSRNFGKEAGLDAGLTKALELGSDLIAVMDVDLQDPPQLLNEMCSRVLSGECDVAAAYRTTRQGESRVRSWFARRFYSLMNAASDVEMKDGARDFRVMTRKVVRAVLDMPERNRFSKGIFAWVGFKTSWVAYENIEREHDSTSWSFTGLVRYAIDGMLAFTTVPLEVISITGVIAFLIALAFLLVIVVRALAFGDPVAGWPSLMAAIVMFGGLNLLGIGTVGLYISKIYSESKHRPLYIVAEER